MLIDIQSGEPEKIFCFWSTGRVKIYFVVSRAQIFFLYIIVRLAMIFCLLFTFLHVSFFLKRSIRSNNSSIDSRWVYCVTFFINRMFTFFVVHFGVRFTGTLVVSVTIFWSGQAWNRKWIKCLHHHKQEIEMVASAMNVRYAKESGYGWNVIVLFLLLTFRLERSLPKHIDTIFLCIFMFTFKFISLKRENVHLKDFCDRVFLTNFAFLLAVSNYCRFKVKKAILITCTSAFQNSIF